MCLWVRKSPSFLFFSVWPSPRIFLYFITTHLDIEPTKNFHTFFMHLLLTSPLTFFCVCIAFYFLLRVLEKMCLTALLLKHLKNLWNKIFRETLIIVSQQWKIKYDLYGIYASIFPYRDHFINVVLTTLKIWDSILIWSSDYCLIIY